MTGSRITSASHAMMADLGGLRRLHVLDQLDELADAGRDRGDFFGLLRGPLRPAADVDPGQGREPFAWPHAARRICSSRGDSMT